MLHIIIKFNFQNGYDTQVSCVRLREVLKRDELARITTAAKEMPFARKLSLFSLPRYRHHHNFSFTHTRTLMEAHSLRQAICLVMRHV
jgi:hypothetical protein